LQGRFRAKVLKWAPFDVHAQVHRIATLHQGPKRHRRVLLAMSDDPNTAEDSSTSPPPFAAAPASSSSSSSAPSFTSPLADFDFQELLDKVNFSSLDLDFDISSLTGNADKIRDNLMEGKLGERGEVYVAAQFGILVCIAIGGIPFVGGLITFLLGPGLLLAGLASIFLGVTGLGGGLSPFPVPVASPVEGVVDTGIYGQLRHPMYAGLLATCAGLSIVTDSATRLLLTAGLIYLLDVKSNYEEEELVKKYPEDYAAYMKEVEGKFFPQKLLDELPWGNKE
jgi:protein-S-isoprenylcysteine O-methyltransferase Ste14